METPAAGSGGGVGVGNSTSTATTSIVQQKQAESVLWCYKKELGFSTHRKKRMEKIARDKKRGLAKQTSAILLAGKSVIPSSNSSSEQVDNFELFLTNTDITWCYYKDTHRILGTTHSLLVLQDFEALTPNIMARTIETVCGGGLVIILLRSVTSLKQLYVMTMDVHSRYRTEGGNGGDVVPRFNERFILSLGRCNNCLICDDELNILPLSKRNISRLTKLGLNNGGGGGGVDYVEDNDDDYVVKRHVTASVSGGNNDNNGWQQQWMTAMHDETQQSTKITRWWWWWWL
jgi:tRNA(Met) C34 N-acetyltransferase TmcA